jgi:Fic-DOC domain mobile mystery protein B
MVANYLFKDRDGQTPLPRELRRGLLLSHIMTIGELDEYEESNIAEGMIWLDRQRGDDCLTYPFWLELHRRLFGNVWSWAGTVRTHQLNDPDFLAPGEIWPALRMFEDDLAFWIANASFQPGELAGRIHERIETIHPFANGNGRFGRIWVEHLCLHRGTDAPTWGAFASETPNERRRIYIDALVRARRDKDYAPLEAFMFS